MWKKMFPGSVPHEVQPLDLVGSLWALKLPTNIGAAKRRINEQWEKKAIAVLPATHGQPILQATSTHVLFHSRSKA